MEPCDLCLSPSGRYHAHRECCQIRLLSTMPQHARAAAYERTKAVGGKAAMELLRQKVVAEYQRLNGARLAAHKAKIQSLKNLIGAARA